MTDESYQRAVVEQLNAIRGDVAYLRARQDEHGELLTRLRIEVGQNKIKHSIAAWAVSTIVPAIITFAVLGINKLLGW